MTTSSRRDLTGSVFSLARWFQAPVDASAAEDDFVRDDVLNDLWRNSTEVAVRTDDDGTTSVLVVTSAGAAMIETNPGQPGIVVVDYVRSDRWGRTRFWMNASSLRLLGDTLRTLPRRPFDELFIGA